MLIYSIETLCYIDFCVCSTVLLASELLYIKLCKRGEGEGKNLYTLFTLINGSLKNITQKRP